MSSVDEGTFARWNDDPQVKTALHLARWPRCSTAEFLEHLIAVLDAKETLSGKVDFAELVSRIVDVDLDREAGVPDRAVAHAVWMLRQGLPVEVTCNAFGLSPNELAAARKASSLRDEGLRLHGAGRTVKQIARELHVNEQTVRRWLSELDLAPNRARGLTDETRETILNLRDRGVGPKEISERLGLSIDRVKQVVYGDRHKKEKAA